MTASSLAAAAWGTTVMRNLSLFTGSGIGDWAAAQAGIETVAQCENDSCCLFCLEKLWPGVPKFDDIRTLSADALRDVGPIDIISGGFPCTDISSAGKGAGIEGSRSGLWFEMLRVIDEVRPAWVLAENVPTLRVRGADIVLDGLEGLGYTCWPVVVGADDVGAPHRRKRVWIVAHAEGIGQREQNNEARPEPWQDARAGACGGSRWPSRPGEPQHDWEAPRLTECGVGCPVDGVPGLVHRRANKALLRILGNAWVPQIPVLIYRWIAEQEQG